MSREAKIILAICAAAAVVVVALGGERRPGAGVQRPLDQTVVYARVQHGPGVTQFVPLSGPGAQVAAPIYSNGELTQIRSFGKNGEQIIYQVSPGQEGKFLYVRSLGPNGTLVYEPASLNPKPAQPVADASQSAADAQQVAAPPSLINFSAIQPSAPPGGKPPATGAAPFEVAATGKLAREWSEVFSSLTGAVRGAAAEAVPK